MLKLFSLVEMTLMYFRGTHRQVGGGAREGGLPTAAKGFFFFLGKKSCLIGINAKLCTENEISQKCGKCQDNTVKHRAQKVHKLLRW
jgi:hypothetical protein